MGTFFKYEPEEIFNDELYEMINSSVDVFDMINDSITPQFGDCILYNKHKQSIYIRKYIDICKEQEESVIGIVISANNDIIDCVMKNFLTTESQILPYIYKLRNDNTGASAHFKQLFDRYIQKYQRITNMEFIKSISYYIPNVIQLDYIQQNFEAFTNTIRNIYDEDKVIGFTNVWKNGILTTYNNKLYIWKHTEYKREIAHIINNPSCNFLPCFTIKYSFDNYE